MLFMLDLGMNSLKDDTFVIGRPSSHVWLLSLDASDVKYLLNAFAMTLRSIIRSLFMINCGFVDFRDFPLNSFMIGQVFLLSPLHLTPGILTHRVFFELP